VVVKAAVACDRCLEEARGRCPHSGVNLGVGSAAEAGAVLDVQLVDQAGDHVHVPGGHLDAVYRHRARSHACHPAPPPDARHYDQ
jgi:hypothetical protein